MASQQIFDFPAILDDGSQLLTLTEATKVLPVRLSRAAIERAVRRGSRGTLLKTILIGNRRYTTERALREWLVGQQNVGPESVQPISPRGKMSSKELSEKSKKFNLPESNDEPSSKREG